MDLSQFQIIMELYSRGSKHIHFRDRSAECDTLEESKKTLVIFLQGSERIAWAEALNVLLVSHSFSWH